MVTEFSHVDIVDKIHFDTITFEFEVDPELLANKTASNVRVNRLSPSTQCGPRPARCLLEKKLLYPNTKFLSYMIRRFTSGCANESSGSINWNDEFKCHLRSNTSLLVVSVGKRLVVDSLQEDVSFNASGQFPANDSVIITNMRKIFSVTVGQLSWDLTGLTDEFHATCDPSMDSCSGLQLELASSADQSNSSSLAQNQRLVVGVDALPLNSITPTGDLSGLDPRMLPFIRLKELARLQRLVNRI